MGLSLRGEGIDWAGIESLLDDLQVRLQDRPRQHRLPPLPAEVFAHEGIHGALHSCRIRAVQSDHIHLSGEGIVHGADDVAARSRIERISNEIPAAPQHRQQTVVVDVPERDQAAFVRGGGD